jgi:hypothetical protein
MMNRSIVLIVAAMVLVGCGSDTATSSSSTTTPCRGSCPPYSAAQVTFLARLRPLSPESKGYTDVDILENGRAACLILNISNGTRGLFDETMASHPENRERSIVLFINASQLLCPEWRAAVEGWRL